MCARFVKYLSTEAPEYIAHLARLASIGLLTEVVEDFARPITTEGKVDLTIAVDAPLALDFLGCSGTALQDDVRRIFDALRSIGCRFIVFPITSDEVQRNLQSMLSKRPSERYGYTHDALLKREVIPEFVQAVARDPEGALQKAGIQVRPLTLSQYPNSHKWFNNQYYEDFFSAVYWVEDVAPREHDATCVALLMRLREGRHHSDLFRCGYVLATRNATFVRESRKYCLESRLINQRQEGPVIHQRELATLAWLRTGLGIAQQIPRGHLLAVCEQVLRVRMEVSEAVGKKLRQITPEKIEQFELLLQDHRSVRKLADETLNDETIVTADNAEQLLEAMRKATIAEERQEFERNLQEQKKRHSELQRKARAETTEARSAMLRAEEERDEAKAALAARKERDKEAADEFARRIARRAGLVEKLASIFLLLMGGVAILQYFTGWLSTSFAWTCVLAVAGLIGLYDFITNRLERPKVGIPTLLKWYCRWAFARRLKKANLPDQSIEQFEFEGCSIRRKNDVDYV
jgi:hypothetical protein